MLEGSLPSMACRAGGERGGPGRGGCISVVAARVRWCWRTLLSTMPSPHGAGPLLCSYAVLPRFSHLENACLAA